MSDLPVDTLSVYRYQPLDLTKQQIRLVAVRPASHPEDPVQCDLQTFDMDTAPNYVALSYMWGPPTPTGNIYISSKRLEIRQNLLDFLNAYRNDRSNIHYIWIDQICISQAHSGERNHQVQMMSTIYRNCLETVIWLGFNERTPATALAIQWSLTTSSPEDGNASGLLAAVPPKLSSFTGKCAKRILRNSYFSRLWIVQEIMLPPAVRVLCGDVWIPFDKLVQSSNSRSGLNKGTLNSAFSNARFHMYNRKRAGVDMFESIASVYQGNRHELSLHQCVMNFMWQRCEDPRDKVYGLLGLVRESERLTVDYGKSKQEVFLEVFIALSRSSDWGIWSPGVYEEAGALLDNMDLGGYKDSFHTFRHQLNRIWREGSSPLQDSGFEEVPFPFRALGFDEKSCSWWHDQEPSADIL